MIKLTKYIQLPEGLVGKGEYADGTVADIDVGYTIIGDLIFPIKVGNPIQVLRKFRNGVQCSGCFTSSVVESIEEDGLIKTQNSVYKIEEVLYERQ
jgi:hypothetical protein